MAREVKTILGLTDFSLSGTQSVSANTPIRLGRFQNGKPKTKLFLGQNNPTGYIAIDVKNDTAGNVNGIIELKLVPANESQSITVLRKRTETLRGSTEDKTKMVEFPRQNIGVGYLGYIEIWFTPDASATVDYSNCSMRIDATYVYE